MSKSHHQGQRDGGKNSGALEPGEIEAIRAALVLKRHELTRFQATQLSELRSPDRHHLADLEEMASDTDTESLCEQIDVGFHTLEEIDAALEKIERGTYGVCEVCEEPIPRARLEALPFASLCVNCKREAERGGG